MVAITVILAAVIGAFVLDLGSQLGSTGPQTQLAVSDHENNFAVDDGSTQTFVNIEHKGGDTLKSDELRIVVQSGSSTVATFEAGSWTTSSSNQTIAVHTTSGTTPSTTDFSVGETWTITETNDDTSGGGVLSDGTYTVKVIHKPSNSVVTSTKVEVN